MYAKVIDKHSRRASVPSVVCDERGLISWLKIMLFNMPHDSKIFQLVAECWALASVDGCQLRDTWCEVKWLE